MFDSSVHEPSAPTQPATRDGRFERKVKCAGYFNQFKEELLADDNPEFTSSFLDELFYSPTLDTCVAAFHIDYLKAPVGPDVVYMLEDALSHKILFDFSIKKDAKAEGKWIAKRGELAQ